MAGPFFFAWCDEATVWGPDLHRWDEEIFELELGDAEGDFPSLQLDVKNPRVGLLAAGRNLWGWLAWDNGTAVIPLFHGRLVGVPENLHDEIVRLMFIARPSDYPAQKAALAQTLRVLPFHDPVWQEQQAIDDDSVLETRTLAWQVDRLTLQLSASDELEGEDGTIEIGPDDHFYDAMSVGYAEAPLRRVKVTGTVSYLQQATGQVDLTQRLVSAFQAAGSFFPWPLVGSYTANGLFNSWPQPEAGMGGGWSMALGSSAIEATFVSPSLYGVRYTDKSDSTSVLGVSQRDQFGNALPGEMSREFFVGWRNYDVTFGMSALQVNFACQYDAARKRSEIVTFTMAADVQSILTDPGASEEETIDFTSDLVDKPVDPEGALPIGDLRRNSYFTTDRGQQSLQFLMLLAAARLLTRARAVNIGFQTAFALLAEIVSCRKSVRLLDDRLPGGEATGKITKYRLTASGSGGNIAEVTIGCSVGYGIPLGNALPGEDTYADDYADDYTETTGGQTEIIPGQLLYESLDGTVVVDDDGVDFFNMIPERVVKSLTITGGPNEQRAAIDRSLVETLDTTAHSVAGFVSGTTVTDMTGELEGLDTSVHYDVTGFRIPNLHGVGGTRTTFVFDGTAGGTLSQGVPDPTAHFPNGMPLDFILSRPSGGVITPDPIGALRAMPTIVALELVPVSGGNFLTPIVVDVAHLVVPKTIDLEAAS